jgi:hypothetical protein
MAPRKAKVETLLPIESATTPRLANAAFSQWPGTNVSMGDLWTTSPTAVDKLEFDNHDKWTKVLKDCRFFYKHDPLAWTVINKMVDFAINEIVVYHDTKLNVSQTERAIIEALNQDVTKFLRRAALEYLTTGLVVPEITFTRLNRQQLRDKGIKRIDNLMYPTSMWVRDAATIEIQSPILSDQKSYFLLISDDVVFFIQNNGKYADGSEDIELYRKIATQYPDFVRSVKAGEKKVLLDNPLVVEGISLSSDKYPIPYMFAALEPLKHKRNLRRMDYSIAARVISAILHVKAGSDEFPLTEDQNNVLEDLEEKFKWRDVASGRTDDIERVFALFTNHTIEIGWVFPEVTALLDDKKYTTVNSDITVALGFPRILITGETERSFASDPQVATLSPLQTMERMRAALLPIIQKVYYEMRDRNDVVTSIPDLKFRPINLMSMQLFYTGLKDLYDSGNISRGAYDEAYGYDLRSEILKRKDEKDLIKETGVEEFAPVPHSNVPGQGGPAPKKAPAKPAGRPAGTPAKKPTAKASEDEAEEEAQDA